MGALPPVENHEIFNVPRDIFKKKKEQKGDTALPV